MPSRKTRKTSKIRTYKILDNGGYVFIAEVDPTRIQVFKQDYDINTNIYTRSRKVLDTAYTKLFVGDNLLRTRRGAPKGMWPGNSLLIQTGEKQYIYVGSEIYSFKIPDHITKYYSPVGNSHVPYPYAVGEENTYFMLEKQTLPNELLDLEEDGYGQFYGWTIKDPEQKAAIEAVKRSFRIKKIKTN